jgi:hypothetical protein
MLISYGNDSIQVDFKEGLNFREDYEAVISSVKPQKKLSFRTEKVNDTYVPFDFLTEKEIGLVNFLVAVGEYKALALERCFSTKEYKMLVYAKQIGSEFTLSPVDPFDYSVYQKCIMLHRMADIAFNQEIYSRLGYDLHYRYDDSGQLYCLKDLRTVLSAAL